MTDKAQLRKRVTIVVTVILIVINIVVPEPPKVCRIMVFWTISGFLGHYFTYCWGPGRNEAESQGLWHSEASYLAIVAESTSLRAKLNSSSLSSSSL